MWRSLWFIIYFWASVDRAMSTKLNWHFYAISILSRTPKLTSLLKIWESNALKSANAPIKSHIFAATTTHNMVLPVLPRNPTRRFALGTLPGQRTLASTWFPHQRVFCHSERQDFRRHGHWSYKPHQMKRLIRMAGLEEPSPKQRNGEFCIWQ